MKIVFLSDDFPPYSFGGAGISTYELAMGMQRAGHDVVIITTCRNKEDAGESMYDGLTLYKIAHAYHERWSAYLSLYNPVVVREVDKILRDIKPDVVHAHNIHYYLSYHSLKIAKRHASKVIFTFRDTMAITYGKLGTERYLKDFDPIVSWKDNLKQAQKRWNPLRNFIIRMYLRHVDRRFAISRSLQDAMTKNGIDNVELIYNGLAYDEWQEGIEGIISFKKKNCLDDKKVILFGGRLSEAKGGEKTILAMVQIVKEVPNAVLLVAGHVNEYAERMQSLAQELGIKEKIIFTGWIEREDIKTTYFASDVVLMPSIYLDAFGRVNIEAMAAKKPVVGTCYGGTPEVIVDGITGYVVNPLYLEQIAEKTIELLKDEEKAQKFGKAGYDRLVQEFSINDKVRQYIDVYQQSKK